MPLARKCHRLWTGSRANPLRFGATTILSHKMGPYRDPQVRLRGMDPDICHLDVDQGLHMPLPKAYTCHQSTHKATRSFNCPLDIVECDHHHPVDCAVPARGRRLGLKCAGFLFLKGPARENCSCSSRSVNHVFSPVSAP